MTLWYCFEGYGNELECRRMVSNPLLRAPSLLGTGILWCDIVQEFTRRKITKDTDRLPALAALAEQYREVTGKQYLAGMWLEDLPTTLLWRPRGKFESPTTYCAPSWSWASIEGPVRFLDKTPGCNDVPIATVTSTQCEYFPPGTLSTVTSGWLDIEGPMTLVTGRRNEGYKLSLFIHDASLDKYSSWWTRRGQYTGCTEEDIAWSRIYLLQVVKRRRFECSFALILQEVKDQSGGKDTFRRLGYARRVRCGGTHGWEDRSIRLI